MPSPRVIISCSPHRFAVRAATHYHTRAWQTLIYGKECFILLSTLSLPSTSKTQYLSAKHVSRTHEYWEYIGSTQSISKTIQPIAVKNIHRMFLIYKTFIWPNNNKNSHVTVGGHFKSRIENMKNAYRQLFYARKKINIHLHQISNIRIYPDIILFH